MARSSELASAVFEHGAGDRGPQELGGSREPISVRHFAARIETERGLEPYTNSCERNLMPHRRTRLIRKSGRKAAERLRKSLINRGRKIALAYFAQVRVIQEYDHAGSPTVIGRARGVKPEHIRALAEQCGGAWCPWQNGIDHGRHHLVPIATR